jgi:AcrR family transcriptional regulator
METTRKQPGRPRDAGADQAILDATVALMAESGTDAATIAAIADRAGVARATLYLRWPTRQALLMAAVRHAIGRRPIEPTGDIEVDFKRGAEQARLVLSTPAFVSVLPEFVRAMTRDRQDDLEFTYDLLFPGRAAIADQYAREAGRQGFRTDVEPSLGVDMIVGALLILVLATRKAPTKAAAAHAAEVATVGLRNGHRVFSGSHL